MMENANNLSKNFDVSVKNFAPSPTGWESDAILKDLLPEDRELRTVQNERSEKKKQREKESK
jgi:hypothetical protein